MKKWFLGIIFGIGMIMEGHTKELDSFNEISNALSQGNKIKMVVQIDDPETSKKIISFFTEANAVMIHSAYLQFANTHLTTNHPGFEKIPLLENVTYRISKEGEVQITTRVITLPDYQVKGEHALVGLLGRSVKIYTND